MKNKTIMLSCIAAVAIAAMVGKKTYGSHVSETNNLLLQNVEALTMDEENSEEQELCGTKMVYYGTNGLIKCPTCGAKTGITGVQYSYQRKGNDTSYRSGFCGRSVACTPYHGYIERIDNVKTYSCEN